MKRTGEFLMKKVLTILAALGLATTAHARDNVQIAGSSTVLPYATIVAEAFGENFDFPTPVVESGGSSAGLKRFCEGVGPNTVDIANASRQIREKEIAACAENGVTDITEVLIGYDGIVFASDINGYSYDFTPKDIYLALNEESTATVWSDVNPAFPDQPIMMFIPGTKHGTREVFEEKVLLVGCEEVNGPAETDEAEAACVSVRTDGKSVDIDGDYTETLARISSSSDGIGVFGLAFYENNTDVLQVATMNSVVPSTETIASAEYPVSRPLFFYIKDAHIGTIPGILEYAQFFMSDDIAGAGGPLAMYGLVADPEIGKTQEMLANK
jgi:phosphate transport system substrate-binding protein